MDVTDAERCATVIENLHPWAVVNNAGYSGVGAIEDITDKEARRRARDHGRRTDAFGPSVLVPHA